MPGSKCDILYCEGPGDIIAAYESWKFHIDHPSESSITFSGQLFEFCRSENVTLYATSTCPRRDMRIDRQFTLINFPRFQINLPKIGYDLSLTIHSLRLLALAFRLRPKMILMCTGVTDFGVLSLFCLTGAQVVIVAHNTLWPEGFPPSGYRAAMRRLSQRLLWRRSVAASIVVSPAVRRQIESITSLPAKEVFVMRPTFPASAFGDPPPPRDFSSSPFRLMFAGRVEQNKGVFDLLAMAEGLRERSARNFEIDICGDGSSLELLRQQIKGRGLEKVVRTYGRLDREALVARYTDSHVVIVPTRSSFAEGFAMVVAEAILLLRPVITSKAVPASEVLAGAVVMAKTDDVSSYVSELDSLMKNEGRYLQLVENCRGLRPFILDDSSSFLATLRLLKPHLHLFDCSGV